MRLISDSFSEILESSFSISLRICLSSMDLADMFEPIETLQPPVFQPFLSIVTTFRGISQRLCHMYQMAGGNLLSRRKLGKEGVHRSNMKCRNKLFQFGKENGNNPGNRPFELNTFLNLFKTVTSE